MNKLLNISSNLSNFVLPEKIISYDDNIIITERHFQHEPAWIMLETMAQTAALHQRINADYKKHFFLLKICRQHLTSTVIDGEVSIQAKLEAHSSTTASYNITAYIDDKIICTTKLLTGSRNFLSKDEKNLLENHYRKIVTCLSKN